MREHRALRLDLGVLRQPRAHARRPQRALQLAPAHLRAPAAAVRALDVAVRQLARVEHVRQHRDAATADEPHLERPQGGRKPARPEVRAALRPGHGRQPRPAHDEADPAPVELGEEAVAAEARVHQEQRVRRQPVEHLLEERALPEPRAAEAPAEGHAQRRMDQRDEERLRLARLARDAAVCAEVRARARERDARAVDRERDEAADARRARARLEAAALDLGAAAARAGEAGAQRGGHEALVGGVEPDAPRGADRGRDDRAREVERREDEDGDERAEGPLGAPVRRWRGVGEREDFLDGRGAGKTISFTRHPAALQSLTHRSLLAGVVTRDNGPSATEVFPRLKSSRLDAATRDS